MARKCKEDEIMYSIVFDAWVEVDPFLFGGYATEEYNIGHTKEVLDGLKEVLCELQKYQVYPTLVEEVIRRTIFPANVITRPGKKEPEVNPADIKRMAELIVKGMESKKVNIRRWAKNSQPSS